MKYASIIKRPRLICAVLALTLLCLGAAGCYPTPSQPAGNEGAVSTGADTGFTTDDLGSAPHWLTECLLLPSTPYSLGVTDCFGNAGHSGIASPTLVEKEGKLKVNETSLLLCLYYGHNVDEYAPLQTFLQFTMITSDGVLRDEECVEEVVFSEYPLPSSAWDYHEVDFSLDPENRIPVTQMPENQHQGMYAISFIPKVAGTLTVEFSLSMKDQFIDHTVDAQSIAVVVEESDKNAFPLTVERFDVGFLTEADYNQGDFADEDLIAEPPIVSGPVYAVIEYRIKTEQRSDTPAEFMIVTSAMDRGFVDVTVEEAATDSNEYFATEESILYRNRFTASVNEGGVKEGRLVLRLKPLDLGTIPVSFFITSTVPMNQDITASKSYIIRTEPADLCYSYLSPTEQEKGFYTVSKVLNQELESVRIPDTMGDHSPVTQITNRAFSLCRNLKSVYIGKNVTYIGSLVFEGCMELSSIDFGGTVAEWEAMEKSFDWKEQSGIVEVRCTDGTVDMPPFVVDTPPMPAG